MIVQDMRRLVANNRSRRSAFTLLEVLVVVAILIVLASVAGVAVFKFLEDSYEDKAILDMQTLEKSYKSFVLKSGYTPDQIESEFNMNMLVPYLEQGQASLTDPWNKQYLYRFGTSDGGTSRIQFYTTNKGKELVWPRQ